MWVSSNIEASSSSLENSKWFDCWIACQVNKNYYFVTRAFLTLNTLDVNRCREQTQRTKMDLWHCESIPNKIKDVNLNKTPKMRKKLFKSGWAVVEAVLSMCKVRGSIPMTKNVNKYIKIQAKFNRLFQGLFENLDLGSLEFLNLFINFKKYLLRHPHF